MVLLKRLSKAIADGDPIQGVILGTSLNQDGHTNGISLPSPEAQTRSFKMRAKTQELHRNKLVLLKLTAPEPPSAIQLKPMRSPKRFVATGR
jgi:3-oxoacyl-(acyl-carrier-protein) synthase